MVSLPSKPQDKANEILDIECNAETLTVVVHIRERKSKAPRSSGSIPRVTLAT
jgi:hypothetical protein